MRYVIHIIIIFWPICLKAQPINHEQIALDHFMEKIFDLKYKKLKAIEFSGFTENALTRIRYGNNCFENLPDLHINLFFNAQDKLITEKKIILPFRKGLKIKRINMFSSKRFKLLICGVNTVNDRFYVSIEMFKLNYHVDIYLFEMDKMGNILRWCETGATF